MTERNQPTEPEQPQAQVVIKLLPNGAIQVHGPTNSLLLLGMLEMAKVSLMQSLAQNPRNKQMVEIPNFIPPK